MIKSRSLFELQLIEPTRKVVGSLCFRAEEMSDDFHR
jgi:hypothetical protein